METKESKQHNQSKPAALITGAGSGIGAATARLFSCMGHDVVLVGRRKELLEETASTLQTKSFVLPASVRSGPEVDWVVAEAIKEAPHIGILVNNAGIFERKSFLESDDDLWTRTYETNLLGPVRLARGLVPHFKKKGGVIVNVASTAGLRPLEGMIPYSTFKAALIHLTQSLALECAPFQIRVHAVCPGIVDTPILGLPEANAEKKKQELASLHPLGRMGKPEDVAWAIYELTRPETGWMTGVILPVDGGISLK